MNYEQAVELGYGGPPPRRRTRYACSDMMCGALDCETCYGVGAGDYHNQEAEVARPWLAHSGYEYDELENQWETRVLSRVRRCRRDHKDGTVKAGDTYRHTVWRIVCDSTGESRHVHAKTVLKHASEEG